MQRGHFEEVARLAAPPRGRESQCHDGVQRGVEAGQPPQLQFFHQLFKAGKGAFFAVKHRTPRTASVRLSASFLKLLFPEAAPATAAALILLFAGLGLQICFRRWFDRRMREEEAREREDLAPPPDGE